MNGQKKIKQIGNRAILIAKNLDVLHFKMTLWHQTANLCCKGNLTYFWLIQGEILTYICVLNNSVVILFTWNQEYIHPTELFIGTKITR